MQMYLENLSLIRTFAPRNEETGDTDYIFKWLAGDESPVGDQRVDAIEHRLCDG